MKDLRLAKFTRHLDMLFIGDRLAWENQHMMLHPGGVDRVYLFRRQRLGKIHIAHFGANRRMQFADSEAGIGLFVRERHDPSPYTFSLDA